jgi:hypothetical protein
VIKAEEQLAALEAAEKCASLGPWENTRDDGSASAFRNATKGYPSLTTYSTCFTFGVDVAAIPESADAAFIAALRNNATAMFSEIRLLRGELLKFQESQPWDSCRFCDGGQDDHSSDCWLRSDRELGQP